MPLVIEGCSVFRVVIFLNHQEFAINQLAQQTRDILPDLLLRDTRKSGAQDRHDLIRLPGGIKKVQYGVPKGVEFKITTVSLSMSSSS